MKVGMGTSNSDSREFESRGGASVGALLMSGHDDERGEMEGRGGDTTTSLGKGGSHLLSSASRLLVLSELSWVIPTRGTCAGDMDTNWLER